VFTGRNSGPSIAAGREALEELFMRRVLGVVFTLVTSIAAAQDVAPIAVPNPDGVTHPDTVPGVEALLRGDYTRAATILRPVVEAWPSGGSDDAAVLFLATLYDSGLGTPQDRVRACALYERAAKNAGPVGTMARAAGAALRDTLTAGEWSDCQMLAVIGTRHRFEPVRVALADDYWVSVDLSSKPTQAVTAVVSQRGKEKRTRIDLPVKSGMVFLPVEFTELQVGGVSPGTRRFLEVAAWVPSEDRDWHLAWTIVELVGPDLVPVTTRFLSMAVGPLPPDDLSLRLREVVDLRVNDAGEAEWAIVGLDEQPEVIETAAMRREINQRDRRRKAAAKRIKSETRHDPDRAPSLAYTDADGCGDVLMYGWTAERAEWIAIRADKEALQLSTTPRIFDLAQPQVDIDVVTDVFESPRDQWGLCGEAALQPEGERQERWHAVAGTVTIQLSQPGISARNPGQYRTSVQIDNAEFMGPTGERVRSPRPIRMNAVTGPAWVAEP
jgi:hypothetical protein